MRASDINLKINLALPKPLIALIYIMFLFMRKQQASNCKLREKIENFKIYKQNAKNIKYGSITETRHLCQPFTRLYHEWLIKDNASRWIINKNNRICTVWGVRFFSLLFNLLRFLELDSKTSCIISLDWFNDFPY